MVVIPVPSGNWGLGPSLLYLFGVIAVMIYFEREFRKLDRDRPKHWWTKEEYDKEVAKQKERDKAELFTRLLVQAAEERKAKRAATKEADSSAYRATKAPGSPTHTQSRR